MKPIRAVVACVAIAVAGTACAANGGPGTTVSGTPTGSGSPAPRRTHAQLQLAVLRAVGGRLLYCDPDEFPVARADPVENARHRLPQMRANAATFRSLLAYVHLANSSTFTDQQLVALDQAFKQMSAILLTPRGDAFAFSVTVPTASVSANPQGADRVSGTVSSTGRVRITSRTPGARPNCPICLAKGDLIGTPTGPVAVENVRIGMRVWTADSRGDRVAGRVVAVGRSVAPIGHEVVKVTLVDGRTVVASPGHPSFDGEPIGAFSVGDPFAGSTIRSISISPYRSPLTYDLLASGPTGAYFVGGVLLRSTLAPLRGLGPEARAGAR
jgi:hypothetical protein